MKLEYIQIKADKISCYVSDKKIEQSKKDEYTPLYKDCKVVEECIKYKHI